MPVQKFAQFLTESYRVIHIDKPDDFIKKIIRHTFPRFKGRKVRVIINDPNRRFSVNSNWDSGYRTLYMGINLNTFQTVQIGDPMMHPARREAWQEVTIPYNTALVAYGQNGSSPDTLEINIRNDNAANLLPAPDDSVTDDMKTVLKYTRSLKNTYAGETNLRFREAKRETGITAERWEEAKLACIKKGYLTAAGSITANGRNASGTGY
jgi:hypothetical protein